MAADGPTSSSPKSVIVREGVQRVTIAESVFEVSTRYQIRKPIGHGAYGAWAVPRGPPALAAHACCAARAPVLPRTQESSCACRVAEVLLSHSDADLAAVSKLARHPAAPAPHRSALDTQTGKKVAIKKIPCVLPCCRALGWACRRSRPPTPLHCPPALHVLWPAPAQELLRGHHGRQAHPA